MLGRLSQPPKILPAYPNQRIPPAMSMVNIRSPAIHARLSSILILARMMMMVPRTALGETAPPPAPSTTQ